MYEVATYLSPHTTPSTNTPQEDPQCHLQLGPAEVDKALAKPDAVYACAEHKAFVAFRGVLGVLHGHDMVVMRCLFPK